MGTEPENSIPSEYHMIQFENQFKFSTRTLLAFTFPQKMQQYLVTSWKLGVGYILILIPFFKKKLPILQIQGHYQHPLHPLHCHTKAAANF